MRTNAVKKMLTLLLCLALLVCVMPAGLALEPGTDGFVFMAANASGILVKPEYIPVSAGQTLLQALEAAGHTFLIEGGFLYEIDGKGGNYSIRDNDGAYDLNAAAAGKTSLIIAENGSLNADADALVLALAGVCLRTDNAGNYPKVQTAVEKSLDSILSGNSFADCLSELELAIKEYEDWYHGPQYSVSFQVTKGGKAFTKSTITLTDIYGNVVSETGSTLSLRPTEYEFIVSDGGYNRTEGHITVSGDAAMTRSVALPNGEWYSSVSLQNIDRVKYPSRDDRTKHHVTIQVPDTVGTVGLYLNAAEGAIPTGTLLRTAFIGVDGKDKSTIARSWGSNTTSVSQLLTTGMEGRTFDLEARYEDSNGDVEIQTYTISIERLPTLKSLLVMDNGANGLSTFVAESNAFEMDAVSDSVTLDWQTFGSDYTVTVNGESQREVALSEGENTISIEVTSGRMTNSYQVKVNRIASVPVTLQIPDDTEVLVENAAGAAVAPSNGQTYALIAGQTYTYTATKATWYHSQASFVAQADMTVLVSEPETAEAMTDFAVYQTGAVKNRFAFDGDSPFTLGTHEMSYRVSDANSAVYVQATKQDGYTAQAVFYAHATSESMYGSLKETTIRYAVDESKMATGLTYSLVAGGYGQVITVRLSKTEEGITYYQDYLVHINRSSHMQSILLKDENQDALLMYDEAGEVIAFDRDRMEYTVNVTDSAEEISLQGDFFGTGGETPVCGGYHALVNGEEMDVTQGVVLPLNPEKSQETITLTVSHEDSENTPATYTFRIVKLKPVNITVNTDPAEARVFITNNANGKTQTNNKGTFALTPKNKYTVTVTANGYVGQSLTYTAPDSDDVMTVTLEKAAENTNLTELEAQWPYFRADENNNGIVDVPTPKKAEEAVLYWANRVGEGWDTGACGCPILVDDCLYVYADTRIVKVDSLTGETLAVGEMDRTSSFAINSPTYADGMIFVGLSNGGVQAFDAVTLESLWIYNDAKKGQPNCPIYYYKGYIYTGFWNGETLYANAVCLSVTDEDPSNPKEEKLATWTYTCKGGFYWSGSYVTDNFALIPTDDGESGYTTGYATLVSINPETGNVIDVWNLPDKGDARTSVCYDEVTNKYWFGTKGGYVYGAAVNEDGTFDRTNMSRIALYNYANDSTNPAMTTCTPAIYNGRMYVGVSGVAQFGAYSGHNITVIDLTKEKIAYTVRTQGYPQTSGLVTTAYEEEEGCVYVYFFDNYTPGKLRVIRDRPGQTEPDEILVEGNVEKGVTVFYDTAPILFTPDGAQAQYAICSPIADKYGTLYFKNDSGYLMAVGSTIEKLEITTMPDKTAYHIGDSFDPTGMVVTATYANGVTRDVTKYVTYSDLPLTEDDCDFIISYEYVMYQNKDGQAGVEYTAPAQVLTLSVTEGEDVRGDINGDGEMTLLDVSLLFHIYTGEKEAAVTSSVLDVNGDGTFNLMDVAVLFRMVSEGA